MNSNLVNQLFHTYVPNIDESSPGEGMLIALACGPSSYANRLKGHRGKAKIAKALFIFTILFKVGPFINIFSPEMCQEPPFSSIKMNFSSNL